MNSRELRSLEEVNVIAKAIAEADGQDWDELSKTYGGRQRRYDYCRFALAARDALSSSDAKRSGS